MVVSEVYEERRVNNPGENVHTFVAFIRFSARALAGRETRVAGHREHGVGYFSQVSI
jgi:hypothetical protein